MTDGVFVVSTGRCGSTLLSELVNLHPRLVSLSEFFMTIVSRSFIYDELTGAQFWKILSSPAPGARKTFDPKQNPKEFLYPLDESKSFERATLPPICFVTLPHLTDQPDALFFELEQVIVPRPRRPIGEQYRFLFDTLRERFDGAEWIERSGGSLAFLPSFRKHFPRARFVHVYRDGRDTAISIARHPPMRLFAQNWARARRFGLDLLRPPLALGTNRWIARLEPLIAPFAGLERQLATQPPLELTGAFWSALVEFGLAQLKEIEADRRLDIRYEDLLDNPERELLRLTDFIGPGLEDQSWLDQVRQIPGEPRSRFAELSADKQRNLTAACQPGLELLGYH